MALGDSNNNGAKKMYENTYYSRIRFKDYQNQSKKTLSFQFKSGMLIIDISQEKEGFNYESLVNIYVTPTKAKLLLNAIDSFNTAYAAGDLKPNQGFGINAGMGDISSVLALHVDAEGHRAIMIGKIDASGKYVSSEDFVFNVDFHYGLEWKDLAKMDVAKIVDNDIEYQQFCEIVQEYSTAINGAMAYSVADLTRYDTKTIVSRFDSIYDKLGIERSNNNRKSYSGNNFFNNSNRSTGTSEHKSFDEVDDGLPTDDDE